MSSNNSASLVYVPDEQWIWLEAEVIKEDPETHQVDVLITDHLYTDENRSRTLTLPIGNYETLPLQNPSESAEGVADMCSLNFLHEAGILHNLNKRFLARMPYTYTGNVCIAVNPYQWLNIYAAALREQYHRKSRQELPPHVYAISATAYSSLSRNGQNQSILVSGESGAGKTESVKILMGHCAYIASRQGSTTVDKLMKANPLLESFGNSKTTRNDNSSRFGKYTQLEFNRNNMLVGSRCSTYLLEKSRVAAIFEGERNYHIFYQILSAPSHFKRQLRLDSQTKESFRLTNAGDVQMSMIEHVSDADRFLATVDALKLLGMKDVLRDSLLKVVAGILFLGELTFAGLDGDNDKAIIQPENKSSSLPSALENCCSLLGVDEKLTRKAFTWRSIDVEGQKLSVPLTIDQAIGGRDALAKEIYARLFQWLVMVINFNTSYRPSSESETLGTISLLDIFGFESFAVNRFEQLCINYANEKLQQKFTMDVMLSVQNEYIEEGLQWKSIKIHDNAEVLQFIEGRRGLFSLLNEESLIPKGSDSSFFGKVKSSSTAGSAIISIGQLDRNQFSVAHYAGRVSYSVTGFLERNRDVMPEELRDLCANSTNILLGQLFTLNQFFDSRCEEFEGNDLGKFSAATATNILLLDVTSAHDVDGRHNHFPDNLVAAATARTNSSSNISTSIPQKKPSRRTSFMLAETVTTKFKNQLNKLKESISLTQVQYVRCIKPNENRSSTEFNRRIVVEQLRSAGVVEVVRISREAYPNRMSYSDFLHRFGCLKSRQWHRDQHQLLVHAGAIEIQAQKIATVKALVTGLVEKWRTAGLLVEGNRHLQLYQFGRTKLYFSNTVLKLLESGRLLEHSSNVVRVQSVIRSSLDRGKYAMTRRNVIYIQSIARMILARKSLRRTIKSCIKLQSIARMAAGRNFVQQIRRNRAAVKIQATYRMHCARKSFVYLRRQFIHLQSVIRMKIQRRRYLPILTEFRSKISLEMRVLHLEKQLQDEIEKRSEIEKSFIGELYEANCVIDDLRQRSQLADNHLSEACSAIANLELRLKQNDEEYNAAKDRTVLEIERNRDLLFLQDEVIRASEAKDIKIGWLKQEIEHLNQDLATHKIEQSEAINVKNDELQIHIDGLKAKDQQISSLNNIIAELNQNILLLQAAEQSSLAAVATSARSEKAACQALLDFSKQSRQRDHALTAKIKLLEDQIDSLKNHLAGDVERSSVWHGVELVEVGIDGLEEDDSESLASSISNDDIVHPISASNISQEVASLLDPNTSELEESKILNRKRLDSFVAVSDEREDPEEDEYELFSRLLAQLQGSISTKDDEIAHLSALNTSLQDQVSMLKGKVSSLESSSAELKMRLEQSNSSTKIQVDELELSLRTERSLVGVLEAGLLQEQANVTKLKVELLETMKALEKSRQKIDDISNELVLERIRFADDLQNAQGLALERQYHQHDEISIQVVLDSDRCAEEFHNLDGRALESPAKLPLFDGNLEGDSVPSLSYLGQIRVGNERNDEALSGSILALECATIPPKYGTESLILPEISSISDNIIVPSSNDLQFKIKDKANPTVDRPLQNTDNNHFLGTEKSVEIADFPSNKVFLDSTDTNANESVQVLSGVLDTSAHDSNLESDHGVVKLRIENLEENLTLRENLPIDAAENCPSESSVPFQDEDIPAHIVLPALANSNLDVAGQGMRRINEDSNDVGVLQGVEPVLEICSSEDLAATQPKLDISVIDLISANVGINDEKIAEYAALTVNEECNQPCIEVNENIPEISTNQDSSRTPQDVESTQEPAPILPDPIPRPLVSSFGSAFLKSKDGISGQTAVKATNIARLYVPAPRARELTKLSPDDMSVESSVTMSPTLYLENSKEFSLVPDRVMPAQNKAVSFESGGSESQMNITGSSSLSGRKDFKVIPITITQVLDENGSPSVISPRKKPADQLNIIDKRILGTMSTTGLHAKIFLTSKTGGIVDKSIRIQLKKEKRSGVDALLGLTDAVFECELIGGSAGGTTDTAKKFRFNAWDIRSVRKGKGKTIAVKEDDWLCCHILLEGKGELNLSLNNEEDRDSAVKIFKHHMPALPAKQSSASPQLVPERSSPHLIKSEIKTSSTTNPLPNPASVPKDSVVGPKSRIASNMANSTAHAEPKRSLPTPAVTSKISTPTSKLSGPSTSTATAGRKVVGPPSRLTAAVAPIPVSAKRSGAGSSVSMDSPAASVPANIIKHGWVQKEDLKVQSTLFKPYSHKYFILDLQTKTLKFASTPKVLQFPSQLKGFLTLTAEMKVSIYKKVIEKSLVVEIMDAQRRTRLRFITETAAEQEDWARAFRQVISECSVSTNAPPASASEIGDIEVEAEDELGGEIGDEFDPELETF